MKVEWRKGMEREGEGNEEGSRVRVEGDVKKRR